MIIIIDLQNLCSTEKHISFIMSLMEFFIEIGVTNWLFDLRNGFSSQYRFINNTCTTEQHNIAWDILIWTILFFCFRSHQLSRYLWWKRNGFCQKLTISHCVVFWFFVLVTRLNSYNVSRQKFIWGFNYPFIFLEDMGLVRSQCHWSISYQCLNSLDWHRKGCPNQHH